MEQLITQGIYDMQGHQLSVEEWLSSLYLSEAGKQCIAWIGAGGKTSNLFYIAREAAKLGRKVLVTTSTHIYAPPEELAALSEQELEAIWEKHLPAVIGTRLETAPLKWAAPEGQLFKNCFQKADLILIEADGSRERPCKVMRDHEPVVWECVTTVVGVLGMSALGQTIQEAAYPPDLAAELLRKNPDQRLTGQDLGGLVETYWFHKEYVEANKEFIMLFNQIDTLSGTEPAIALAKQLTEQLPIRCYLSCQRQKD